MKITLGLLLTFALVACGEKPQFLNSTKASKPAYLGAKNPFVEKGWTPGDKNSWDAQMKARAQGQTEYSREN
jgi:hypothetical protein